MYSYKIKWLLKSEGPCDGKLMLGPPAAGVDQLLQGWTVCPFSLPWLLALLLIAVGGQMSTHVQTISPNGCWNS